MELPLASAHAHLWVGVRVFTGSDLITGSDRIGPEIGLFFCLTDCFFFTRMNCIKDYVFSAIYALEYINIDINGKKTYSTDPFAMVSYQFTPVVFYIK